MSKSSVLSGTKIWVWTKEAQPSVEETLIALSRSIKSIKHQRVSLSWFGFTRKV